MQVLKKVALATALAFQLNASEIEILPLDVIPYEDFVTGDPEALAKLENALHDKGIVGIRGVPGYREKVQNFIAAARKFSALPEEVKESYAPNHELGETFLGYEKGKEKFKREDGSWVVDDLKVSYYAFVPDCKENKWPREVDLKNPFQEIGKLMLETGKAVMRQIGLIGPTTGISVDEISEPGRMLYYRKSLESAVENPFWCGAHFDHGMFTALLPAFYYEKGEQIPEPIEAGLFVKTTKDGVFRKVIANDPDVMLFQVGEFGQLVSNDAIKATEHRVHKASGCVERFTLALFYDAPLDTLIHSTSELTQDARYGGVAGEPCTYQHWHEESFKRYIVK
jgi:isopenicillin N synthase-like dioxygenase